jgi:iron complex outermembrane recepter protein
MKTARGLPQRKCVRADSARIGPIGLAVAAALYGTAAVQVRPALAADASSTANSSAVVLEPVVVTATKVEENVQDVPEAIQVLTTKAIENLSITHFEDFATKMPTVSFVSDGPTEQTFYMRGVSDGSSANASNTSTTGYFLDDASTSYYGEIPDLHLYDIERIEVLDGPQGTLYGAGAMSGAIRIISNKPNWDSFSAGVDLDGGKIENAGHDTSEEGFVNFPLIAGSTAVRLSGYLVNDGGFIDNVLETRDWVNGVVSTNAPWARNDYNTEKQYGGRAAIAQRITDSWKATLTVNYQNQGTAGSWSQELSLPPYEQRKDARFGPENISDSFTDYDLNVEGDIGIGDLVYASTFWTFPYHYTTEYSNYVQYNPFPSYDQNSPALLQSLTCQTGPTITGGTDPYGGCNPPNMSYSYNQWTHQWSNELRLQSKPGGPWHWLGGLYWEKTRQVYDYFYDLPGIQPSGEAYQSALSYYSSYYTGTAAPLPQEWYSSLSRDDLLETAEFVDIALDITKRLTFEAGARNYDGNLTSSNQWAGYFWQPKTPSGLIGVSAHKVTSKASLSYKAANSLMLYATFSQGFRMGGSNAGAGSDCYQNGVPQTFKPDTLNNFEVGWKSGLLNGRMTWNGAFYYMPWKDFQAPIFDESICPTTFNANFGNARVYGAESNIDLQVTQGLTFEASANYNDSRLTAIKPDFTGVLTDMIVPDERLPFVPYFSYSANVRYERFLSQELKGYIQYDIAHKGDMWSDLRALSNPELGKLGTSRVLQPEYNISNIRLGIERASWTLEAYISNLWNTDAVIYVNTGNSDDRQTTNEPRVFGLRASYNWE